MRSFVQVTVEVIATWSDARTSESGDPELEVVVPGDYLPADLRSNAGAFGSYWDCDASNMCTSGMVGAYGAGSLLLRGGEHASITEQGTGYVRDGVDPTRIQIVGVPKPGYPPRVHLAP